MARSRAGGGGVVVALKKSDLCSSLWLSCDELRDGMDASQDKDYILTLPFVKCISRKAKAVSDDQRGTASLRAAPPLRRAHG